MKKIIRFLKDYRSTPFILLMVTFLSYGLLAPFVGLYMDDWYILWFKHVFGALQYPQYFALDRPLMGYFYLVVSYLLGRSESPLVWQLFAVLMRWLAVYSLWGMLNMIWPANKRQNTWVALLAAVFPGFSQQWFAVIYCFFFFCLAGFFFSITLMVRAIKSPGKFWLYYIASLLLMAYCVSASEFYVGLEMVRGAVIWLVLSRTQAGFWKRVAQTLKYWAVYLGIISAFMIWRAFFFVSVNHEVSILKQLMNQPIFVLIKSLKMVYQAMVDSLLNAWVNPFNISNYPAKGIMGGLIFVVAVIIFVGLVFWLKKLPQGEDAQPTVNQTSWQKEAFWIGLIGVIVAVLPFWAADLKIDYVYPFDRFMLAYLMGSCLLIVALVEFFSSNPKRAYLFVVVLVAAGTAYQVATANVYKNLWNQQKTLYWQLNWRMPALEPNTTLLSWDVPNGDYYSGYALSAQLNWTYAEEITNRQVPYEFILLSRGQNKDVPSLSPNLAIKSNFRTYSFSGNTSNTIYVSYNGESCLRVLDATVTPALGVLADYNKAILDATALSNLSLILPTGTNHPPYQVLGSEPAHTWCYYFEKADLARQLKDYSQTLSFLNEAQENGYKPNELSEWYPFIDAFLHTGDLEQAKAYSLKVLADGNKVYENGVCQIWSKFRDETTDSTVLLQVDTNRSEFHCN